MLSRRLSRRRSDVRPHECRSAYSLRDEAAVCRVAWLEPLCCVEASAHCCVARSAPWDFDTACLCRALYRYDRTHGTWGHGVGSGSMRARPTGGLTVGRSVARGFGPSRIWSPAVRGGRRLGVWDTDAGGITARTSWTPAPSGLTHDMSWNREPGSHKHGRIRGTRSRRPAG